MKRSAKIVATIGPSSQDKNSIDSLLDAGVDVARLNFSHGTHEDHARVYDRLRNCAEKQRRSITILQDLQGPKIRVGQISGDQKTLKAGQELILTTRPAKGESDKVSVDFPELPRSVRPGGRILLDDGNLELSVVSINDDEINTLVVLGGVLKSHKGINLPNAKMDIPGFTEKDRTDLEFGLHLGIDAVALSFVRSANDIHIVRDAIRSYAPHRIHTPIIAKLEKPEALEDLDAILQAADGVMVARGDLGVEMPPETVPIAQKRIIAAANRRAKLVITATQMLDSMILKPRPTRAEASDVANAIFDGSDAVMLSGETASGKYPLQAVETMSAIICQAEANDNDWGHCNFPEVEADVNDDTFFMTRAAKELAHDRNVAAIAVFTISGRTARLMSKNRPTVPILAFTPDIQTYHRLNLYWGVRPYWVPQVETIEAMLREVEAVMISTSQIRPGQQVVLICGFPVKDARPTNMALLHTVRSPT